MIWVTVSKFQGLGFRAQGEFRVAQQCWRATMRTVNNKCNLCPEESGRIMHSLTARDTAIDSRRQTYNRMQGLHAVVCVAGSLLEKKRGSLVTYIIWVKGLRLRV